MRPTDNTKNFINPLDEIVEDLCFGVQLYRKAAFHAEDYDIQSILLDLADSRDYALANILPYTSVMEKGLQVKFRTEIARSRKIFDVIKELGKDRDLVVVSQIEGETLAVMEKVIQTTGNDLVSRIVMDLAVKFEKKLNQLLNSSPLVA